jgi:plastocyanin
MNSLKLIAVIAFLAGITTGFAAERSIRQKGKVFSETEVTVKKGEALVFVNDDNIAHNVLSTTPGHKFNLGLIQPGHSTPVTFSTPGNVGILCAIHPTMKMMVKVTE